MTRKKYATGYNRRNKSFQKLALDAFIYTPLIFLGRTKRTRKKALNKWFKLF